MKINSALLCTNHLFMWAGSELFIIEIAEQLLRRGLNVTFFCNYVSETFFRDLFGNRVTYTTDPDLLDLKKFQLVYAQHQLFQLALHAQRGRWKSDDTGPIVVWSHLSPTTPLETPGPFVEALLADQILANSVETQRALARFGGPFSFSVLWPNPAPEEFSIANSPDDNEYLVVSNHAVRELDAALELLVERGAVVRRVGQHHIPERVRAEHIRRAKAVITIGKTVQYALRASRPVYCYGPHGGPGWLTKQTYALSKDQNFSGRSHPDRKTSGDIASELYHDLAEAKTWAQSINPEAEGFCLEGRIVRLLEESQNLLNEPAWRARRLGWFAEPAIWDKIALEANLCSAIRKFYLKGRNTVSMPSTPPNTNARSTGG